MNNFFHEQPASSEVLSMTTKKKEALKFISVSVVPSENDFRLFFFFFFFLSSVGGGVGCRREKKKVKGRICALLMLSFK